MNMIAGFDNIILDDEFNLDDLYAKILGEMIYGSKARNQVDFMFGKKLINQIIIEKVRFFNFLLNFVLFFGFLNIY